MNIDGVEYVPIKRTDWQIVVCHRGFVYVGQVEDRENEVILREAFNVRRWGTERGLGQLAITGPTENTKLDFVGVVRVHPLSIVCRIDCEFNQWAK